MPSVPLPVIVHCQLRAHRFAFEFGQAYLVPGRTRAFVCEGGRPFVQVPTHVAALQQIYRRGIGRNRGCFQKGIADGQPQGHGRTRSGPASVFDFVMPEPYKPEKYVDGTHSYDGEKKNLVTALNETLKAEFRNNPDTFLWGQDVANKEKGGVFNVTKGMQQEFGIKRIFNGPIAEDYIIGTANGMSRYDKKMRIVIEGAEFADYFWPGIEQFVECTHDYWRSNGQYVPNVTVRLASGGYIGGGLYHSQNLEGALTTLPGVRIVYPSFADDAAGLLRTSIRSKGFTMFMEPKALYNAVEAATPIPDDFEVPFGKARIRHDGDDLTIVTYGNTTHFCLSVAARIKKESGKTVEVIDLRSLIPLDKEAIYASVKKTNKVLIVHEDKVFSGFGAELAASIGTDMFQYLDAPIQRVGSIFTPVGFHRNLEKGHSSERRPHTQSGNGFIELLNTFDMKKIGLFYGTGTHKTASVAKKIKDAFGDSIEVVSVEEAWQKDFEAYDYIIAGAATWFDGELPTFWDELMPKLLTLNLKGKKVAIFGLGDQVKYPDNFVDGIGILAESFISTGATIVGLTSSEGYHFNKSQALIGGHFAGLALDFENQHELNDKRIHDWVEALKAEFK